MCYLETEQSLMWHVEAWRDRWRNRATYCQLYNLLLRVQVRFLVDVETFILLTVASCCSCFNSTTLHVSSAHLVGGWMIPSVRKDGREKNHCSYKESFSHPHYRLCILVIYRLETWSLTVGKSLHLIVLRRWEKEIRNGRKSRKKLHS